jgi:hypothetical protein
LIVNAEVLSNISYPGLAFEIIYEGHQPFLRVTCDEGTCNHTGKPLVWKGRKWRLSEHMTSGEIVQTAFLAVITALEHEAREKFAYRGVSVFDPHYDIERLVELRRDPSSIKEREAA